MSRLRAPFRFPSGMSMSGSTSNTRHRGPWTGDDTSAEACLIGWPVSNAGCAEISGTPLPIWLPLHEKPALRTEEDNGISVVVPTFNDRDGLDELLHALADQTSAPDEVVVVDGGSTDGTMELLEAWHARSRVPIKILSGSSLSIGAARNIGVQAASHQWIACTDAGCRPVPRWLRAIDAAR